MSALGMPPCRRQKQRTGVIEFERLSAGGAESYAFTQPPPPVQRVLEVQALAPMLAALGLQTSELDRRCPAIAAGVGGSRALIAVRDGASLAQLRPDLPRLAALTASGAPAGYFVYTLALPYPDARPRLACSVPVSASRRTRSAAMPSPCSVLICLSWACS